jgi:acyl carrier protein
MGIDIVELVMEAEEEFEVTIPDAIASGVETAGELSEVIRERLAALGLPEIDPWPRVQRLISDQLGVPIERVTPKAHFVRDLGCA